MLSQQCKDTTLLSLKIAELSESYQLYASKQNIGSLMSSPDSRDLAWKNKRTLENHGVATCPGQTVQDRGMLYMSYNGARQWLHEVCQVALLAHGDLLQVVASQADTVSTSQSTAPLTHASSVPYGTMFA